MSSHDDRWPHVYRPATLHRAGRLSWKRLALSTPDTSIESFKPVESLALWLGGKRNLAKRLVARIEATPHDCYAEPFCGMAGVFFLRRRRPKSELVNNINGESVNLFRVVRGHPDERARRTCTSSRSFATPISIRVRSRPGPFDLAQSPPSAKPKGQAATRLHRSGRNDGERIEASVSAPPHTL